MTIFVTSQSRVTLDSIPNSCDVFFCKGSHLKLISKVEAADVSFSDVRFQQLGMKFVQIVMTRAACSQQDWKLSLMEKIT